MSESRKPPNIGIADWDGEPRPLHEVNTPPLSPETETFLREHGCLLTQTATGVHIIFPAGSTRTQLYPQTMDARFRLFLPDGTELREVRPYLQTPACSYLSYPNPDASIDEEAAGEQEHERGADAAGKG